MNRDLYLATREEAKTDGFRKFRRQLYHVALSRILQVLKPYFERWEVVRCSDEHYRRVVYGLGPYIADYEEQALLACIVRNWCARSVSEYYSSILATVNTHLISKMPGPPEKSR